MNQEALVYWAVLASAVMFVGSLILLPIIIIKLPADYFVRDEKRFSFLSKQHPAVRYVVLFLKNVLGGLLLLAGIVMLIGPGQGVLAILAGLTLVDVPGKRRLERKILGRPSLQKVMNAVRRKAGKPKFELPE